MLFFPLGGNTTTGPSANQLKNANPTGIGFGLAPRVGYVIGMSDIFSFWLRGGLSVYTETIAQPTNRCNNATDDTSVTVWGLDLDPQVVISPATHFAFTAGPALDWGFAGSSSFTRNGAPNCASKTETSYGFNSLFFGINAGLIGWF